MRDMFADLPPPDNKLLWEQGAASSAACAAAMPAPVSLSESEPEEDALAAFADSFTAPQWTEKSREAALTNTLTALSFAGVPVANTSIDAVLDSLRKIVTITDAPAEAEVKFTLRPRSFLRPHVDAVPAGSGQTATFEIELQ